MPPFHESITWSKISSGVISFRYKPFGHIYDVAGTSVFADPEMLVYLLAFCNSGVAMCFAKMLSPTLNYEVGHISSFPVIDKKDAVKKVNSIAKDLIELSKKEWDSFETSWDFKKHPLV